MRLATKPNVLFAVVATALALMVAAAGADAPQQKQKDAPPADKATPTREQILKEGPAALEEHCLQCHGSDKWEGTNRDREGWTATVREMSRQMAEGGMTPPGERTTNVIVGYLTLTRPQ